LTLIYYLYYVAWCTIHQTSNCCTYNTILGMYYTYIHTLYKHGTRTRKVVTKMIHGCYSVQIVHKTHTHTCVRKNRKCIKGRWSESSTVTNYLNYLYVNQHVDGCTCIRRILRTTFLQAANLTHSRVHCTYKQNINTCFLPGKSY